MFECYKDVLTVDEVCKALSMGKNTIYKLLNDEIIKVYSLYENVAVIGLLANLDMIVNRPQNFYCYLGNKHDKFF